MPKFEKHRNLVGGVINMCIYFLAICSLHEKHQESILSRDGHYNGNNILRYTNTNLQISEAILTLVLIKLWFDNNLEIYNN